MSFKYFISTSINKFFESVKIDTQHLRFTSIVIHHEKITEKFYYQWNLKTKRTIIQHFFFVLVILKIDDTPGSYKSRTVVHHRTPLFVDLLFKNIYFFLCLFTLFYSHEYRTLQIEQWINRYSKNYLNHRSSFSLCTCTSFFFSHTGF